MAARRLTNSIPIWVRVSGIIALVLVGVVVSSMLLGGTGGGMQGGSHGSGSEMEMTTDSGAGHGSGGGMQGGGHGSGGGMDHR